MNGLTHHEITALFFALAALLAVARIMGELATRLRQPAVMGEILAGILLGPTVLGSIAPGLSGALFPTEGNFPVALHGLVTVSITLFLLVAGMEVDLSTVFRQGKAAFHIGLTGMAVPMIAGLALAWHFPRLLGAGDDADPFVFALFFATAMSISALPVIIKILIDLKLFRSDIGMVIVASAILRDLIGWCIFAVVLGMMGGQSGISQMGATVVMTILFVVATLTAGRWLLDRLLPWVQAYATWPGGVLGFILTGGFLCAAITEWIGIHAIFGAFIFGVAVGDSNHLRAHTRTTLEQFISFIFAPIFFASIGLQVNFVANFDLLLVLVVMAVGTISMVGGCTIGARLSGMNPRESLGIGCAMNARGAMEIILGLLALQFALISERLFVALVVLALFTSISSGSLMQFILQRRRTIRFQDFVTGKRFIPSLKSTDCKEAIRELALTTCQGAEIDADAAFEAVWHRERTMSTSMDHGLAVPHARIEGLRLPLIGVGLSRHGVDFNAMDGEPARLVILILTPRKDPRTQLDILADIGETFSDAALVERCAQVATFTELLALIQSHKGESSHNRG